jgi:hypothetical protein
MSCTHDCNQGRDCVCPGMTCIDEPTQVAARASGAVTEVGNFWLPDIDPQEMTDGEIVVSALLIFATVAVFCGVLGYLYQIFN